jgi:type VI secretion system protein ImpH
MPAKECQPVAGLSLPLSRYEFYRALNAMREAGLASPHFVNCPTLAFPVRDMRAMEGNAMAPAFLGLLGVAGSLPYHYAERFAVAPDAQAFLNLLSTRAVVLFDAAWRKHRLEFEPERLTAMLLALSGGEEEPMLAHAAAMRSPIVSASMLEDALGSRLGVAVQVEQFQGQWQALPAALHARLGRSGCALGIDTVAGPRQWRADGGIALRIGPLARTQYLALLPDGELAGVLRRSLSCFALEGMQVVVRPLLAADAVEGAQLSGRVQLGFDAFLSPTAHFTPDACLQYLLSC